MCKVLYISGSYPPEPCGIGHYLKNLVIRQKIYSKITIATINPDPKSNNGIDLVKYPKDIFPLILKNKIDIIHWQLVTQGFRYSILFLLYFLLFRFLNRRIKIITTFHDFATLKKLNQIRLLLPLICSHEIIATTEEQALFLKKWNRNVNIIPIGSNVNFTNKKKDIFQRKLKRELKILFWGFPVQNRMVFPLLGALNKLNNHFDFSLTFMPGFINISNSLKKQYLSCIQDFGLEKKIHYTGLLPENKMEKLLTSFDLAALFYLDGVSVRRTTFIGLAGLAVPFITNFGSHTPTWLYKEIQFSAVKHLEIELIADKITEFTFQPDIFKAESEKLSKIIETDFNWESICKKHQKIYQNTRNHA